MYDWPYPYVASITVGRNYGKPLVRSAVHILADLAAYIDNLSR